MKTRTFNKRTSRFCKGSNGYQLAAKLLKGETNWGFGNKLRTCWTSGSGRFTKNMDYTDDTLEVLRYAGLKKGVDFTLENDAARGSATGNYLVLTPKGKRKMLQD
jgi:hypothetical protein